MNFGLLTATMVFMATNAMAQHANHGNQILETGQSQFAAIAEIVASLRNNPDTEWQRVNVDALRAHLVDMDNVTTKATVDTTVTDLTVTFDISGDASVAASIQRMVLAHGPMLQQTTNWPVMTEKQVGGAKMVLQLSSVDEIAEVTALGFFGLMTIGAHHQQHHMMIAMVHSPH